MRRALYMVGGAYAGWAWCVRAVPVGGGLLPVGGALELIMASGAKIKRLGSVRAIAIKKVSCDHLPEAYL